MVEEYIILKQDGPSFSLDKWAQPENWNLSRQNSLLFAPKKCIVTFNVKFHASDEKDFTNIKTNIFTKQNTGRSSYPEENLWWNFVLKLLKNYQNQRLI